MTNLFAVLLIAVLFSFPGARRPAETSGPARHRFHVSYGQMGVEGTVAVCRIRFFKHDLVDALRHYHDAPDLALDVSPRIDSLFTAYFNVRFKLEVERHVLPGRIAGSGEETLGQEEMWWYVMQYEAPAPIGTLTVTNTLLFDLFDDQKNIFKVRHFPDETEKTYYFNNEAETYTVAF